MRFSGSAAKISRQVLGSPDLSTFILAMQSTCDETAEFPTAYDEKLCSIFFVLRIPVRKAALWVMW